MVQVFFSGIDFERRLRMKALCVQIGGHSSDNSDAGGCRAGYLSERVVLKN